MLGGENYWIYGYLVIFVWLECTIAIGIVRKRLPFNSEVGLMQQDELPVKKARFLDLARVPEFIFILILVSICASIAVAESVNPKGVNLAPLSLGG